ncbi:MAG: hypothetical protein RL711_459 [Bacteroidota bacterium]
MKFSFIDNIRFYSILSIVTFHSCLVFLEFNKNDIVYDHTRQVEILSLMQFLRFGNICFFMVSGFLFGHSMKNSISAPSDAIHYVKKRWAVLKVPTLLFSFILAILGLFIPVVKHFLSGDLLTFSMMVKQVCKDFFFGYTWFIYNLFLGLLLIIVINMYTSLKKTIFISTFILAIFWSINPYFQWINVTAHMFTFLGFSFYILLGYYLGMHQDLFQKILQFINNNRLFYVGMLIITFLIAYWESIYLYNNTSVLPYYNLKLSTQIQSIVIFFGFCSFCTRPLYPSIFKPSVETVGIYFLHTIVVFLLYFGSFAILILGFNIKGKEEIPFQIIPFLLIFSAIFVYLFTVICVKYIVKTKYSFLIGIKKS